ncbi:MAG: hypothetical protein GC155_11545 [Alphaproteobacteria bacterium]|nr:hypothetical protein [Alphaproteobacteria bacterium]
MSAYKLGVSIAALGLAASIMSAPACAQALGPQSGVNFADPNEAVSGPKPIEGATSFISPLPFFRDLTAWDPNYKPPRTPDGHPDLQGVWSSASLTTMTRGVQGRAGVNIDTLVIPDSRIAEITNKAGYNKYLDDAKKRTDPKAGVFTDKNVDRGYNGFWIDPGSEYTKVNGEWRSSYITDPANGQIPYSKDGRENVRFRVNRQAQMSNTGPEARGYGERCLISFGNQGGPPLSSAMYNNNIQIVQTPDNVMLDIEMNHDARIVSLEKPGHKIAARPDAIKPWFGDEVGRWDGDTLVVETRNLHPLQARGRIPLSDQGKVIERFRRVSPVEIFYQFEVDDPVNYSQVWKGEMTLRKSKEQVYEYACHEGNYAMPGILRGMNAGRDTALGSEGEGG